LFTLAVYALPFFAGLFAGFAAFHSGVGVIGALVVGVLTGGATLAIVQIAFAIIRTPLIRAAIGLLYAVPAAIAGYHGTLGLDQIGVPPEAWREVFAVIGSVPIGGAAWVRMFLFLPSTVGQGVAAGSGGRPSGVKTYASVLHAILWPNRIQIYCRQALLSCHRVSITYYPR
jgi:hypothetical protein